MTNLHTIPNFEKLHDLFERVHPSKMPGKLVKLITWIEEAAEHHAVEISDVTSVLYDMESAFRQAMGRSDRSLLLTNDKTKYEVNLYPIMNFLSDNPEINGEMDNLKSRIIQLAYDKNIAEMKEVYSFVDGLSITMDFTA